MLLSRRAKEAIKTALALAIAMGVALALGWEKPYWAGFAVAMISLQTAGASLNKGFLRVMGTLAAAVVAILLLSAFTQERWLFLSVLTLWVGYCVYRMRSQKGEYFWQTSGVTAMILIVSAGTTSESAFNIVVARTQETGLGVLVYSLVTFLLWKESGRGALDKTLRDLIAGQHKLFQACRGLTGGAAPTQALRHLAMQEAQHLTDFEHAINAAETDSFAVWEVRRQWRALHHHSRRLMVALGGWRESTRELAHLDRPQVVPNLDAFFAEIERRFAGLPELLDGRAPQQPLHRMALDVDMSAVRALPLFDRAAVAVARTQLERLESATAAVTELIADIRQVGPTASKDLLSLPRTAGLALDPDRLVAAIRVC